MIEHLYNINIIFLLWLRELRVKEIGPKRTIKVVESIFIFYEKNDQQLIPMWIRSSRYNNRDDSGKKFGKNLIIHKFTILSTFILINRFMSWNRKLTENSICELENYERFFFEKIHSNNKEAKLHAFNQVCSECEAFMSHKVKCISEEEKSPLVCEASKYSAEVQMVSLTY